ncbi:hypothetical protein Tco_0536504 [Tanacetum coccineum]
MERIREERSTKDEAILDDISRKPNKSKVVVSPKEIDKENEAENATGDNLVRKAEEKLKKIDEEKSEETPNSQSRMKRGFQLRNTVLGYTKAEIKIEKVIKNDIEPIAPTMTINRLVMEWEEKIKLHQEKEMKFDQWRSKIFNNEHPASMKEECEVEDEGEVT